MDKVSDLRYCLVKWRGLGRSAALAIRPRQIELIGEVVGGYPDLSRTGLAHTVCELLGWERPSWRLKRRECLDLLQQLEEQGVAVLPGKQPRRPMGSRTRVPMTLAGNP